MARLSFMAASSRQDGSKRASQSLPGSANHFSSQGNEGVREWREARMLLSGEVPSQNKRPLHEVSFITFPAMAPLSH